MGVIGANTAREAIGGLRRRSLSRFLAPAGLGIGLALGVAALIRYDVSGYGRGMLVLWLSGLAVLTLYFWSRSRSLPRIARLDLVIPGGLALLFSPLYLLAPYRWPVQVSSDEVTVMSVSQDYASRADVDLFGLSNYWARPAMLFVAWGKLGNLLGGVDLYHMRLLEAGFGLIGIALSYALFRQLVPRVWAICAACLLGFSHSYLMISRLAMRENTAVLAEVAALALLLWGLRRDNELATFLGGVVAGLGFYVYYPSRATFPIWVVFLVALAIFYRHRFPLRNLLRLGAVGVAGFVLMAGPIQIAEKKAPPGVTKPQRETLMIYPEGRLVQQQWVFARTPWDGYVANVKYGLGTFNSKVVDHAWIYQNPGHGFVDPLTGLLLWLGVGVVGIQLVRRRAGPEALLLLGSFIILWLSFAFVVNKAPNYTRLLVTLPFVAYLVTEALRWLAGRWRPLSRAPTSIVVVLVGAVAVWNLVIAWDFIQQGRKSGDPIGSTGRYVQSHRDIPGQQFYVASPNVTSGDVSYFTYGTAADRLRIFARDQRQVASDIDPSQLSSFNANPPFALFMRRGVWSTSGTSLAVKYPHGRLRNVLPAGTHVVFEVSAS